MSDEKRNEDLEEQEGSPLPAREMMSLITGDPTHGLALPGLGADTPAPAPGPADHPGGPYAQPLPGDQMHTQDGDGTVSPDPRSETITQSDSASAG